MIKSNKNKKVTDYIYSLNSLINKIENNIELINKDDYTKLWSKTQELSYEGQSAVCLIFSNGMFDIINSYEELYEDVDYQDSILIDVISRPFGCSDLEKIYQWMECQLYDTFFTEFWKNKLKDSCLENIASIINSSRILNLEALWHKKIPYSIASNEQKIYYWLAKYIPDELIYYITEYYLNNYDETINIKEFQKDFVKFIFDETIWYQETEAINDAFLKLEDENLLSSLYSFCTAFLKAS